MKTVVLFQLSTTEVNGCGDVSLLLNELKNKGHVVECVGENKWNNQLVCIKI